MLNRNKGCRWAEFYWKGIKTIIMENEVLRIEVLADKGTDIVEFLYKPKDIDFMWRGPIPIYQFSKMIPTISSKIGSFIDYYPGGWQEIFPNGGLPTEYKGTIIGLHGEISLLPWEYEVIDDSLEKISIKFKVRTYRTPFLVEKIIHIEKENPSITIEENITNEAEENMDFIWGHHPSFGKPFISSDCVIKIKKAKIIVAKGDGKSFSNLKQTEGLWPFVEGVDGKKVDISRCPGENDKVSDVIFLTELQDNNYEIINEKLKIGFRLEFPISIFRNLWFWRVAKGSFNYPWYGRTYNIALEPFSSLPVLSEAIKRGDNLSLEPWKNLKAKIIASVVEI